MTHPTPRKPPTALQPAPGATGLPTPVEPLVPGPDLLAAAAELGVQFDSGDVERLGRFLALMLETNKVMNLTAITEPAEAWRRHILDALTLVGILSELPDGSKVIDVGSGGGVPGIPLAVVMPGLKFTLLEPTGKKAAFLNRAADEIGLPNVVVVADRAERIGQDRKKHREMYDTAIVRAVGPLAVIAELAGPLVKVGGVMLAIKGEKAQQEVESAAEALKAVGLEHEQTMATPTGQIVVLMKAKQTARIYPRADGEPKRKPLG